MILVSMFMYLPAFALFYLMVLLYVHWAQKSRGKCKKI
nr:MAG TPA: PET assembly of cytochrome c oxidase, mitochondrial [Caudoviricetes sp.]